MHLVCYKALLNAEDRVTLGLHSVKVLKEPAALGRLLRVELLHGLFHLVNCV